MKIFALTRYSRQGASSRMRFHIFFKELKNQGFKINEDHLFDDIYLENLYSGRQRNFVYILKRYIRRIFILFTLYKYDFLWIEKELFPMFPAIFERIFKLLGFKMIVDYDDAVFHNYDQGKNLNIYKIFLKKKIDVVMKASTIVLCGNSYIAKRAYDAGAKNVVLIPTIVDLRKYQVENIQNDKVIIGWIGTPMTEHYLDIVSEALQQLTLKYDFSLKLIGSNKIISNVDTIYAPWSEEQEALDIQSIDIGIMPLPNLPWEKGKCGYKLIQYMACGKPVIGSSVGVNKELINHGLNGYLANNHEEWVDNLEILITDHQKRKNFGIEGRNLVETKYELQIALKLLSREFKKVEKLN